MANTVAQLANAFAEIETLVMDGHYRAAADVVDSIREAAAARPVGSKDRADFDHYAGVVAYHSENYGQAIAHLTHAAEARRHLASMIELAETLRNLGACYRANGALSEAEPHYDEARQILEEHFPNGDKRLADVLNNLTVLFYYQSRLIEAEAVCRRALDMRRHILGDIHHDVGQSLAALGEILVAQGRVFEGADACRQSVETQSEALDPHHPDLAASLNNLAVAQYELGNFTQAEEALRRALEIDALVYGTGTLEVAIDLQNLAEILCRLRRFEDAVTIHREALQTRRDNLPSNHPDIALSLSNLGNALDGAGQWEEAKASYEEAMSIEETIAKGERSIGLASVLNNYGDFVRRIGDRDKALILFKKGLAILPEGAEKGRLHTSLLNNLADVSQRLDKVSEAETLFRAVVSIREGSLPPDHPDIAHSLSRLADIRANQGDLDEAVDLSRRAVGIVSGRFIDTSIKNPGGTADEARLSFETLMTHAGLLIQVIKASPGAAVPSPTEELFRVLQLALTTETSLALSRMAESHAASGSGVAPDIARLRQLSRQEASLKAAIVDASAKKGGSEIEALVVDLHRKLERANAERQSLEKAIPDAVDNLYRVQQLSLIDAQHVLCDDEALLIVLFGARYGISLLLGPSDCVTRMIPVPRDDIEELIASILGTVDLTAGASKLVAFDLNAASKLSELVFGAFGEHLDGIDHVIHVVGEPLGRIPLSILPNTRVQPVSSEAAAGNYRAVPWLIDRWALTAIPGPSSLNALRRRAGRSAAERPYLGFGAPENDASTLPPLPRTVEQLEAIRQALGGAPADMKTGHKATKAALVECLGRSHRVISLATHGLKADETEAMGGPHEPSLLLSGTVPDCLLLASEISELQLDADWIVLSACNTATGGSAGAEGLSGLARAFFEAGARTLLVSHWAVSELSTTMLLTSLFGVVAGTKPRRAVQLRQAMIHVRTHGLPAHAHPAYWGAFSIVGEGWV